MKHILKCSLTSIKSHTATSQVLTNRSRALSYLPYVIDNGYKYYKELTKSIEQRIESFYICVIDKFTTNEVAIGVRDEVQSLYDSSNTMFQQQTGDKEAVRSDLICWLDGKERMTSHIKVLKRSINTLITSLHFDKIPKVTHFTRFQISCFPKKGFGYAVHVDNPNNNGCLLTVVYYCNENYNRKKDGGIHRFFIYDKKTVVDIEPKFNRAVIYWSDFRVAHGTCVCHRQLFSLTSWYFNNMQTSSI